jgi:ribosomal protein L7/L12
MFMSEPPGGGTLDAIRRRIAGQTKSLAIKLYRQSTGAGPAEAKTAVERIQAGRMPAKAEAKALALPPVGAEARAIGEALRAGNRIEAIRLYRAATGLGLKEAKDAIDVIIAEKQAGPRPHAHSPAPEVVQRRRISRTLILLATGAVFGTVFGLVLALSGR